MKLYLIGFRGVGKTTIGKRLADHWSVGFLDLDQQFESLNGSILDFINEFGIENFRRKEFELLRATANSKNLVVATGGGVVDWEPSRDFLLSVRAPKVELHVDLDTIWQRLEPQEKRKVLDIQTFMQMTQLFQTREPFYHKIATFRVPSRDITFALTELDKLRDQLWQAAP